MSGVSVGSEESVGSVRRGGSGVSVGRVMSGGGEGESEGDGV